MKYRSSHRRQRRWAEERAVVIERRNEQVPERGTPKTNNSLLQFDLSVDCAGE